MSSPRAATMRPGFVEAGSHSLGQDTLGLSAQALSASQAFLPVLPGPSALLGDWVRVLMYSMKAVSVPIEEGRKP